MTKLKIDTKLSTAAQESIAGHLARWFARPGIEVPVVLSLRHIERTEPTLEADKDRLVTMRITSVEVPAADQEEPVRDVARAMYLVRTAAGTLDEDTGEMQLARQTLRDAGSSVQAQATARLAAGVRFWLDYTTRIQQKPTLSAQDLRRELDIIRGGMRDLADGGSGQTAFAMSRADA